MTYTATYCECGNFTGSVLSTNEQERKCGECIAQELADELTHPDQELTLDELESDMSAIIEMDGYIRDKLEITSDESMAIIDRAFEIARANTN